MNSTNLENSTDSQDEGIQKPSLPEEAIPGTPSNNLLSYALMVLMAVILIFGGLAFFGNLPWVGNGQPLPGRIDNVPSR